MKFVLHEKATINNTLSLLLKMIKGFHKIYPVKHWDNFKLELVLGNYLKTLTPTVKP